MERLSAAHDTVKSHEYRGLKATEKSYRRALYAMVDEFYAALKNTKYYAPMSEVNNDCILHDVYASIWWVAGSSDPEMEEEAIPFMEKWIGVIHRFVETGTLPIIFGKWSSVFQFNDETLKYELV